MTKIEVEGVQIAYELINPDATKTVAFFNGVMMSYSGWANQIEFFKKAGYRILLHDYKGQLLSEKPEGPYTYPSHAKEIKALFKALDIEKAHIIGISYGGIVGMRFAIDFPEAVESLCIINSLSELNNNVRMLTRVWKRLAEEKNAEDFFWGLATPGYGKSFVEQNLPLLEEKSKILKNVPDDFFEGQLTLYKNFETLNLTPEIHKIKAPTLIIAGDEDQVKGVEFTDILSEKIPNTEYLMIPNCGHAAIIEKPREVNTALFGFISKQDL